MRPATEPPESENPAETDPPGNIRLGSPPPGATVGAFVSADDVQLYGHVFRPGRKVGVILLHASTADERSWFPFAQQLVSAGYTAMTFDFRGYGSSQGTRDPSTAPLDVEGAIDHARLNGVERVALVGTELGGTAAVAAATQTRVRALAAVDAGPSFGSLGASYAASRIDMPALVVSDGSQDAERLAGMIKGAKLQELENLDDVAVQDALLRFLRSALPV